MRYRRVLAGAVACLATATGWALEPARDLAADGAESARRGVPVLLVMTRVDCEYCAALKREVLEPLRLSGDAPRRVLIREVDVDSSAQITGFDGSKASGWSLADGYDALFTPTVLLVGPDGRELTDRILGLNTPEMYGWYLDRAIERATASLDGWPGPSSPGGAGH
jgi:thioredoxin-related protein